LVWFSLIQKRVLGNSHDHILKQILWLNQTTSLATHNSVIYNIENNWTYINQDQLWVDLRSSVVLAFYALQYSRNSNPSFKKESDFYRKILVRQKSCSDRNRSWHDVLIKIQAQAKRSKNCSAIFCESKAPKTCPESCFDAYKPWLDFIYLWTLEICSLQPQTYAKSL